MTDASPTTLPSQVDASSKPNKPTCIDGFFNIIWCYLWMPAFTLGFLFRGRGCSELPYYLIIFSIEAALHILDTLLTMVHNCKLNTFFNPSQIGISVDEETGERYKGHKAMTALNCMNYLLMIAVGTWAFVYALQNLDAKDVEGCYLPWIFLLVSGIIPVLFLVLLVPLTCWACYTTGCKPADEEDEESPSPEEEVEEEGEVTA